MRPRPALRWTAIALLAVAALAGCGGGTVAHGSLHGTVTRGPTMPVCRQGTPCTEPASGIRIVFLQNSAMVAEPVVARDGGYAVSLPAGTYDMDVVERVPPAHDVAIAPSTVRVIAGRTRTVDFTIDTGIR